MKNMMIGIVAALCVASAADAAMYEFACAPDGRLQRVQRDAVCGCHPTSAAQASRASSPPANTGGDPLTSAHMRNWVECVRARKDPHAPVEAGYGHTVALVMSNAALRTGMRATFDEKGRQVLAGGKPWTGYKSIHDGNWFTNLF